MSANPKLAYTARSRTPPRLTLCGVKLRAGYHCVESTVKFYEDPKVTNTARSPTPCRLTLRRVGLCAMLACAEFCQEQFCLFRPLLVFKGNVKQKWIHKCTIQTKTNIFLSDFKGLDWLKIWTAVLACAESNFSNFKFEFLRENEPRWVWVVKKK